MNFCDNNTILFFSVLLIIFSCLNYFSILCKVLRENFSFIPRTIFFSGIANFFLPQLFFHCADNYFSRCNLFIFFDLQYIAGL